MDQKLNHATGDKKYLEPIPRALAYYKRSRRSDGKLARFYELKTNKPLYFTKEYQLTYSDADMPTHYGFVVSSHLGKIERAYKEALESRNAPSLGPRRPPVYKMSSGLAKRARAATDFMDRRGAWVEKGELGYHGSDDKTREIINTKTVVKNIRMLAQFVSAAK